MVISATTSDSKKKATPKRRRITFGSVTVLSDIPSKAEVEKNIKEGQAAMKRLFERLLLQPPGIQLEFKKDVPYYRADPKNISRLIRTLNGKEESGVFKKGKFVACQ